MSSAQRLDRGRMARVVAGVVLLVAGVVLWLALDAPWCGLISGIGVVLLYPLVEQRIAGRSSSEDRSAG